ncbi:hypothetical protein [Methylocaldum sp.]|uniref:hypothetical protein n=1 Tax=Methylocaldum sp. TaxID=1969727 RepID=UPI002D5A633B|nr:hypothetical protein [Methylocaldum sp.]HYE34749.1 hypothetical protein [Methylocaldum sp.]
MQYRRLFNLVLVINLFWIFPSNADSTIEFQVEEGQKKAIQPVVVKDGRIMVKGAGGDRNLDIFYQRADERLVLIDHKKQRFTPITEEKIDQIARQTQDLQPVLQGLGDQLKRLSPKQRAKWEEMLGGISVDQLGSTENPANSSRLVKTGRGKQVAGISCEQLDVLRGSTKLAEVCLASPSSMRLSADDYATIRSLLAFTQRVATKAKGFATQFGVTLPPIDVSDLVGVPIEMVDFSGKHPTVMALNRITDAISPDDRLQVPTGYQPQELAPWR